MDNKNESDKLMVVKDGGPAFPVECDWFRTGDDVELRGVQTGNNSGWETGMSLRDWFAGQVLVGMVSSPLIFPSSDNEAIALHAFALADAMLKERERK